MFIKSDSVHKSVVFLCVALTCAIWSIGLSVFLTSKDVNTMRIAAETYYIAAAGIAWSLLAFSLYITDHKRQKMLSIIAFIPFLCLLLWLALFPETMLTRVNVGDPNTIDLGLTVYFIYCVYFTIYATISFIILARPIFKGGAGLERRRLSYILTAYILGVSFGAVFNLILPLLGNYTLIWVGPIGVSIFAFFVYMSIRHHRLFHARLLFMQTATLFILISLQGVVYFIGLNIIERFAELTMLISTIFMVLLSLLTLAVAAYLINFINRKFKTHLLDSRLLDHISRTALKYTNVEQLIKETMETLTKYLYKNNSIHIDFYENSKHLYCDSDGTELRIDKIKNVRKYVDDSEYNVVITEEIKSHKSVYRLLISKNISAIVKIGDNRSNDEYDNDNDISSYGYLIICTKRATLYSDQEVKVLTTVGSILAMAIRNIQNYEQIRNFNDRLKSEVDAAVYGMKLANKRLVKLNETKDEFLSLASHQLRTPLTSVKGYLSMLLDGDFGKMTPEQTKIINDSFNTSQQMAVTVSDFLDMTRMQTGRFIITKMPTNLAEILKMQISQLKSTAHDRNIDLIDEIESDLPNVNVDQDKIIQVIMNFIDNAIYYSPSGSSVKISLYRKQNNIVFTVQDRGIGVPDKEKPHLFTKFYRATNAKQIRPNGNGVGLYVARRIVATHGGQLIFDSKIGRGSTFGFKVPID